MPIIGSTMVGSREMYKIEVLRRLENVLDMLSYPKSTLRSTIVGPEKVFQNKGS